MLEHGNGTLVVLPPQQGLAEERERGARVAIHLDDAQQGSLRFTPSPQCHVRLCHDDGQLERRGARFETSIAGCDCVLWATEIEIEPRGFEEHGRPRVLSKLPLKHFEPQCGTVHRRSHLCPSYPRRGDPRRRDGVRKSPTMCPARTISTSLIGVLPCSRAAERIGRRLRWDAGSTDDRLRRRTLRGAPRLTPRRFGPRTRHSLTMCSRSCARSRQRGVR